MPSIFVLVCFCCCCQVPESDKKGLRSASDISNMEEGKSGQAKNPKAIFIEVEGLELNAPYLIYKSEITKL